jgi:hypothetical protein
MAMGIGLWYNPNTNRVFKLDFITHDQWLKNPANADELGISSGMQRVIADSMDIDLIRLAATMEGMVRIRDYYRRISLQFYAERGLTALLRKIHCVLEKQPFDHSVPLEIDNLRTDESIQLSVKELGKRLDENSPILIREVDKGNPAGMPDHYLAGKIRNYIVNN